MRASIGASMLPPETTHTTRPEPASTGQHSGRSKGTGTLRHHFRVFQEQAHCARCLLEGDGHGLGRRPPAATATFRAGCCGLLHRRRRTARRRSPWAHRRRARPPGARPSGLDGDDARPRARHLDCAGDPPGRPSAADGHDNDGIGLGQVIDDLQPDRAVARHRRVRPARGFRRIRHGPRTAPPPSPATSARTAL